MSRERLQPQRLRQLQHLPPGPTPFLDLPWDYEGKGLSFNEAALSINSYFDHEYPLLSSGLGEPVGVSDSIVNFQDPSRKDKDYSSHDGYDYGNPAQVHNGDPVLTSTDGCASYNLSSAGGNVIKIDHGNHYQTRYLHLQDTGLITKNSTSCVNVTKGQTIGLVCSTGNSSGAHIHFGVFEDKNKDGNFDDNGKNESRVNYHNRFNIAVRCCNLCCREYE